MTKTERQAKSELEADGWKVIKGGWPDFLAIRNGKVKFVEVKMNYPILARNQSVMAAKLFKYTRIPYEIKVIKRSA